MSSLIPKVKKIIERKAKHFLVELESSEKQLVSIFLLTKHYKPLLDQFISKNQTSKAMKLKKDITTIIDIPIVTQPILNLDNEVKEQHLIEEENFQFQDENDPKVSENDIPEKILCQKTTRMKKYHIEYRTPKGVDIKKVSFNYLKHNYPMKLLDFIQKNTFHEGITLKSNEETMNNLNKLLKDTI